MTGVQTCALPISLTGYCNRESFASRCVWLTQNSRSCAELRYIMPDRAKRKTLEIKWFSAFCGGSPYFLVIRLGLEPRTPTLKVLCSTSWASESCCLWREGVALKSDAKVWTFFVTAKFVSKKIGIVDEMSTMSTNDMVYPYNRGLWWGYRLGLLWNVNPKQTLKH